ncbi:MAG TPA: hypothetical protein VGU26_03805 [Gaiellaceae bacterium]|nr:hypothetical protein [Gaiellaceae bacterium]
MRRLAALIIGVVALAAVGQASAAAPIANGGGRGTVDGVTPFSQFGFGVRFGAAGASGSFNCLMAGSSAFPGFEPLMKVSGRVTAGAIDVAAGTASFTGTGTLNVGPSGHMDALFLVGVREGGPGVGKLHLTVLAPVLPGPRGDGAEQTHLDPLAGPCSSRAAKRSCASSSPAAHVWTAYRRGDGFEGRDAGDE